MQELLGTGARHRFWDWEYLAALTLYTVAASIYWFQGREIVLSLGESGADTV